MDGTEINLTRRARVDVEALAKQSGVHLNKGKQTNGGDLSAVLLAYAPRECDVRAVPYRVRDQQNILPRDWLGRDFLFMFRPVLAQFRSVILIGNLADARFQEQLERTHYRYEARLQWPLRGRSVGIGGLRGGIATHVSRVNSRLTASSLASRDLNLEDLSAAG